MLLRFSSELFLFLACMNAALYPHRVQAKAVKLRGSNGGRVFLKASPKPRRWLGVAAPLAVVVVLGSVVSFGVHRKSPPVPAMFKQPQSLVELLKVPADQLGQVDIAIMNLLCAEGLPGDEGINPGYEAAVLDRWAQEMKRYIASCEGDFFQNPGKFQNNENLCRMTAVLVFLQKIHGVGYNPNRDCFHEANTVFFANSKDFFIHGLVEDPHFGTCSSIPVLLVAIGRRLGYPLKLVITPHHMFARWESPDGQGSFNIEGATQYGMGSNEYDYYRKPPFTRPTDEDANSDEYFHPLTPPEELATFLSLRAYCQLAHKQASEAQKTFALSASIAPSAHSSARAASLLSTYFKKPR